MFFQDSPHIGSLISDPVMLSISVFIQLCLIQDLIRCGLGSEHYWIHSMWLCSPLYWLGKPCFLQSITHHREFQCFIFLDSLLFEASSIFRTGYVSHCSCERNSWLPRAIFSGGIELCGVVLLLVIIAHLKLFGLQDYVSLQLMVTWVCLFD